MNIFKEKEIHPDNFELKPGSIVYCYLCRNTTTGRLHLIPVFVKGAYKLKKKYEVLKTEYFMLGQDGAFHQRADCMVPGSTEPLRLTHRVLDVPRPTPTPATLKGLSPEQVAELREYFNNEAH